MTPSQASRAVLLATVALLSADVWSQAPLAPPFPLGSRPLWFGRRACAGGPGMEVYTPGPVGNPPPPPTCPTQLLASVQAPPTGYTPGTYCLDTQYIVRGRTAVQVDRGLSSGGSILRPASS
jgi:hypothetical protein